MEKHVATETEQIVGTVGAEQARRCFVCEDDLAVDMNADRVGRRVNQPSITFLAVFQSLRCLQLFRDIADNQQIGRLAVSVDWNGC